MMEARFVEDTDSFESENVIKIKMKYSWAYCGSTGYLYVFIICRDK